ncbi:hypothetical protein QAD02_017453 [Eretmocerus hayati]|uniref:Uncharacterized protein n=1 Tax=Eretmocerus hayati TaxID=131215 RepID=A0ACC2PF63_9HYME|nr:hypothetical protein QAD02_017453 [Eretmocerus hayati]
MSVILIFAFCLCTVLCGPITEHKNVESEEICIPHPVGETVSSDTQKCLTDLKVDNETLHKKYGSNWAVNGVSMDEQICRLACVKKPQLEDMMNREAPLGNLNDRTSADPEVLKQLDSDCKHGMKNVCDYAKCLNKELGLFKCRGKATRSTIFEKLYKIMCLVLGL